MECLSCCTANKPQIGRITGSGDAQGKVMEMNAAIAEQGQLNALALGKP
jgi:hypothetical protein